MHRPNSLAAQHRRALGSSCTPQCSKVKEYARESGREPTSRQRRTLKKASVDLCALQPSSREKSEPTIFAGTMPSYVGARCQREARCLHLAATPTAKLSHPSQASRTGDRGAARSRRGPLQAEARTLGVSCRVSPGTTTTIVYTHHIHAGGTTKSGRMSNPSHLEQWGCDREESQEHARPAAVTAFRP